MKPYYKTLKPGVDAVLASKDNGKTWKTYIVDRVVYESLDKFVTCPGLREVNKGVASDFWEHPYNFIFDYSK